MRFIVSFALLGVVWWFTGSAFLACVAAYFVFLGFEGGNSTSKEGPRPAPGGLDAYCVALFRILGCLAKTDGVVSKEEIKEVELLMNAFELDASQRKEAVACFYEGRSSVANSSQLIRCLATEIGEQSELKKMTLQVVASLSAVDGCVCDAEERLLRELHASMMPVEWSIEEFLRSTRDSSPYAILGIKPPADAAAIKKAYLAKCLDFHPDHLDAKKLPPELKAFAAEQMKKIQDAYAYLMAKAN